MANEHSIRVSAKGEFGQLNRGLKQLQGDLKSVLGEIDKGARKGGIFDETSLRALNLYRERFKTTLEDLNKEFEKQNRIVDRLHEKMKTASRREREDLEKQIKLREKEMDVIRRQLFEVEKLYERRSNEADGYGMAGGGGGGGKRVGDRAVSGLFNNMLLGGRGLLGLAGLAGIGTLAHQAYQGAYVSRTHPMDLAQRIRGDNGWEGESYDMWNRGYEIGTRNKMGYTAMETWDFHDQYSREAGSLNEYQLEHLLGFGRAYGLSTSEVASGITGVRELGGFEDPAHFADMIASSVEQSGMQARILEVMQTSAGLLANLNTSLKDTGAKQLLAYQTTLDRIGNEKGMMKLTGQQGANIISGLGGMFDPTNTDNKFMAMRALLNYDPQKYGNMDLYNLEMHAEDGLMNGDNLPAMVKYLKEQTGGDEQLFVRAMRRMLQSGGYSGTLRQIEELSNATNGFSAFSEENMKGVESALDEGDATAPYQERMTEIGQEILDVNSRFEKQLEELGQPLLEVVTGLKSEVTGFAEWLTDNGGIASVLTEIKEFLGENWKSLATVASIVALGTLMFKGLGALATVGGWLFKGLGALTGTNTKGFSLLNAKTLRILGLLGVVAGGIMGAVWLSDRIKQMREEKKKDIQKHYKEGFGLSPEELEEKMAEHGIGYGNLAVGIADPKVAEFIQDLNNQSMKNTGIMDENGNMRTSEEWANWANTQDDSKMTEEDKEQMKKYLQNLQDSGELNLSELYTSGSSDLENLMLSGIEDFGSFADLSEETFGDFFTLTEDTWGDFFDMSEETFDSFYTDGLKEFESLYEDGSMYLHDVFKEHEGFKDFFAGLWEDFMSQVNLGGGLGGDSSLGVGSGYVVTTMSGITAKELNAKLGGKLSGMGQHFIDAGNKYGIDPAVLASIAMHETGNGTSPAIKNKNNVGGMMKSSGGLMSFDSIPKSIDYLGDLLRRLYVNDGLVTVEQIQKRYAPEGASNDPTGLNAHWTKGVYGFLNDFGIGGSVGGMPSGSGSFWKGWQNRVTSEFGAKEWFRSSPHQGLDIDGDQGDALDAVAGGKITKVFYDDGSKLDKDGKKNSTSGGSTVMVQLADGTSYAYAHLSKINPNLREGMQISAGDWIGNMGGEKGKAGSGYSTTGSHLHLGYYDKNGKAINPRKLLNKLSAGELDVNEMMNQGGYSLDMTNRSLGDVMRLATGQAPLGAQQGGGTSTVNVNLKIQGDGAEKLNYATINQLKELVKQFMTEAERQRLAMNPTIAGWV